MLYNDTMTASKENSTIIAKCRLTAKFGYRQLIVETNDLDAQDLFRLWAPGI